MVVSAGHYQQTEDDESVRTRRAGGMSFHVPTGGTACYFALPPNNAAAPPGAASAPSGQSCPTLPDSAQLCRALPSSARLCPSVPDCGLALNLLVSIITAVKIFIHEFHEFVERSGAAASEPCSPSLSKGMVPSVSRGDCEGAVSAAAPLPVSWNEIPRSPLQREFDPHVFPGLALRASTGAIYQTPLRG